MTIENVFHIANNIDIIGERIYLDIPPEITGELDVMIAHRLFFDDWMTVKKYLLKSLSPRLRTLFSTRDPWTKKQTLNGFEKNVVEYYEYQTGKKLRLPC